MRVPGALQLAPAPYRPDGLRHLHAHRLTGTMNEWHPSLKESARAVSSDRERSRKSVPEQNARLIALYQKQAKDYDQSGIHGLEPWRREAVKRLELKRGDLVVDIGCGTGLNFPWLQEAVGPQGRIIGVDLTDAMLEQARLRVAREGWNNVELVQADAASYEFSSQVNGILSTFALTFIPQAKLVIQNGCPALAPGVRGVLLDMSWPRALALWVPAP